MQKTDIFKIELRNILIMYVSTVIGGMLFFLPVLALYFEKDLFTASNVAIIFAVEAIAIVIFEVPTGAIADLFGRKTTLILDYLVTLAAILALYVGGSMAMFIIYAILNAFGRSLSSGSEDALIYDSLKEQGKEIYYKKVIGIFLALWPLGAAIGSIIGGYLASISLKSTVAYSFIPTLISFVLVIFLKEPKYEREEHKNIFRQMNDSFKLVVKNKQLILLFVGGFILMAFGESLHYLKPLFFEDKQISVVYFGYLFAATFGLASAGFYLSDRVSKIIGDKKTLILSTILSPALVIISTLLLGVWAGIINILGSFSYGLRGPVVEDLVNLEISSSKRATVLSIKNFCGQLGTAAVIPIIGVVADLYTVTTAFLISGFLMLASPILYMFLKDKK